MSTADRLLQLLLLFGSHKSEWTIDTAAEELNLSSSNTYRYFRSLVSKGFLVKIASGNYVLGPAIIELDRQMRLRDPMITAAGPEMRKLVLAAPPDSTVILCRYYQGQVICIHEEYLTRPTLTLSYERGLPIPIWRGAASKVILAHLPLRAVRAVWETSPGEMEQFALGRTWTEVKAVLRGIKAITAYRTDGDLGTPTVGLASPIFEERQIVGSIALVQVTSRLEVETESWIAPVSAAAARIGEALGRRGQVATRP